MKLTCLGNRGSRTIPALPNSPYARYGGATTCMLLECGDQTILLDMGSGLHLLPQYLKSRNEQFPDNITVLFSHYHMDHIEGRTLFSGNFTKCAFDMYGPHARYTGQNADFTDILETLSHEPYAPHLEEKFICTRKFTNLCAVKPEIFQIGDAIKVETLPVPHGEITALGYKISDGAQTLCWISDIHHEFKKDNKGNETDEPVLNDRVVDFARGSDILIYDCHFTDGELKADHNLRSFGHSTGEQGIRIAHAAGVPVLLAAHHDPNKDDKVLNTIMKAWANAARPQKVRVIPASPFLEINMDSNLVHAPHQGGYSQLIEIPRVA